MRNLRGFSLGTWARPGWRLAAGLALALLASACSDDSTPTFDANTTDGPDAAPGTPDAALPDAVVCGGLGEDCCATGTACDTGTCIGGICMACTMPGFPDKFMPFMDEPPGGKFSTTAVGLYGTTIRSLRKVTTKTLDKEPKWRARGSTLSTGAARTW